MRINALTFALVAVGAAAGRPDWLVDPSSSFGPATVAKHDTRLVLGNSLIEREFTVAPNFACVSFRSLLKEPQTEMLRSIHPEALISLDGIPYHVGGLILPASPPIGPGNCSAFDCPTAAKLGVWTDTATLATMVRNDTAWSYSSHHLGVTSANYKWTPGTRHAPADVSWPPSGLALHVVFDAPANAPVAHQQLQITVHYELLAGAPVLSKWLTVAPKPGVPLTAVAAVTVSHVVVEYLAVQQPYSPVGLFSYAPSSRSQPYTHSSSRPGRGGSGQADRFIGLLWTEIDSSHAASVNWQDDPIVMPSGGAAPGAGEPVLNISYDQHYPRPLQPGNGTHVFEFAVRLDPNMPGTENSTFTSFRALELVLDSTNQERSALAIRRMKRLLAPASQENPVRVLHTSS